MVNCIDVLNVIRSGIYNTLGTVDGGGPNSQRIPRITGGTSCLYVLFSCNLINSTTI